MVETETVDVTAETLSEATDYALVWGGEVQRPGRQLAMDKFQGELDVAKRRFAHALCQNYWYLTARYGFAASHDFIRDYDTSFEDVDLDEWLTHTHTAMAMSHFCVLERACLWVLVDDAILHRESDSGKTIKQMLDSLPYFVRYPFAYRQRAEKLAWLRQSREKGFPIDDGVPLSDNR